MHYTDGATLYHMWDWHHGSVSGDSGAPFIDTSPSYGIAGILSGVSSTHTYYSTWEYVKAYWGNGFRACITSAC